MAETAYRPRARGVTGYAWRLPSRSCFKGVAAGYRISVDVGGKVTFYFSNVSLGTVRSLLDLVGRCPTHAALVDNCDM